MKNPDKILYWTIDNQTFCIKVYFKNQLSAKLKLKDDEFILKLPVFMFNDTKLSSFLNKSIPILIKNKPARYLKIDLENQTFYYFGSAINFNYQNKIITFLIDNHLIKLKCYNQTNIEKTIWKFLKLALLKKIKMLCEKWSFKFKNQFEIKISNKKTSWATNYLTKKQIIFSQFLVFYDPFCIEYVVCHELAHFNHANHSKAFWNLVLEMFPKYKKAKRMLNKHCYNLELLQRDEVQHD
ncbi:M48 family metallopeptidase [[Mycoplasma] anseris]|uniref:M48 family peptidase n=1 Tax=[Mycoplasma] anseris TaxID=92400 RepID=A0A2Z4NDK7_9BACT|nr:M48 family metallopeptidase [[Mycoplasma] anseris]AWX69673.1 M48 family peptidase [[Mycoplasma] anseris]